MSDRTASAQASVNITTATDTTIVAGQPGKKIYVWQLCLENIHASTDDTITFKTNATALNGGGWLIKAAGGAQTLQFTGMAWFACATGDPLVITTSAAGTISGVINYSIEA